MTRAEKPHEFTFTHFLTMHSHINTHKLKKSEYSYKRVIDKDGGWKWVLTVKKEKSMKDKENANV